MKVWQVEEQEDTTYFCFDGSKKNAREWYIEETMCDKNGISSLTLFPRKKWKDVWIQYDEDNLITTIDEFMQGQTWNEVICSSAYL